MIGPSEQHCIHQLLDGTAISQVPRDGIEVFQEAAQRSPCRTRWLETFAVVEFDNPLTADLDPREALTLLQVLPEATKQTLSAVELATREYAANLAIIGIYDPVRGHGVIE